MSFLSGNEKVDKYLDELSDEYKKMLFQALLERSQTIEDLNISELLRIDNETKRNLVTSNLKEQRKKRTLFLAGMAYILIGLITFISYEIIYRQIFDDIISLVAIVVGFTGTCISLYAFLSSRSISKKVYAESLDKPKSLSLASYEVIIKWRELEGIASDLNMKENNPASYSIIEFFLSNNYLNENEGKTLKDFLRLRNEIVHSVTSNISYDEMATSINSVNNIISKLKKIIQ